MKINFQTLFSFFSVKIALSFCFVFLSGNSLMACQCPLTKLSMDECAKYEIIFKGRILRVVDCDHKFGEAIFEVEELYKGNATKEFKVLFECGVECAQKFNPGEEWIIYSRYKQIDNAKMDWCSRSRKFFKVDKEDFYTVTYGNDYYDELKFLREKLGVHRLLVEHKSQIAERNQRPDTNQMIIILVLSIVSLVVFYYLFNKFFR